jgi:flagellar motor switch protein FliN/FliY
MSEQDEVIVDAVPVDELGNALEQTDEAVAIQASKLDNLTAGATGDGMGLAHLMDVPVRVTVEVGRTKMRLGELVHLSPGSLLELDRAAHEPADILVNGKIVARGEIVTIDKSYGVRITEVE